VKRFGVPGTRGGGEKKVRFPLGRSPESTSEKKKRGATSERKGIKKPKKVLARKGG